MHLRGAVIPCLLACVFTPLVEAKWYYVRSPHFELYTDGERGKAKDILNYLEQVRDVFSKLNDAEFEPDRPVRLVAFNSEDAFSALQRRSESAYAFYLETRERNFIVFQELTKEKMYEVAVHEYIHLRVREMGLPLPVWLNEGLAEFYSTLRPKGKTVRMGFRPGIVRSRGIRTPLSIEEIITASRRDPKIWKNRDIALGLYARSWALTSLLTQHEDYRGKLSELILALVAGVTAANAFPEVFGKTLGEVDRDVDEFFGDGTTPIMIFDTKWDRAKHVLELREVGDEETDLMMADLLRNLGKREEAKQRYTNVLRSEPKSAEAQAGLARLETDGAKRREALGAAAGLGAESAYVYIEYAGLLLQSPKPDMKAVRAALERAAAVSPTLADPHMLLAAMDRAAGKHGEVASRLRRIKSIDWVGNYVRHYWLAQATAAAGSRAEAELAVKQAGAFVRTEHQFDQLHRVLHPEGPSPLAEVDGLRDAGELETAMEKLTTLKEQFPEAAPIYERIADVLEERGDQTHAAEIRDAALRFRRTAVLDAKRRYGANYTRVAFCDAARWHAEARSFFDTLTALNPNDWLLFNNRAYSLAEKGDLPERAVFLAKRAAELAPERNRLAVMDTLGWAYMRAGRLVQALEVFEELVEEKPDRAIFEFHYAYVLAKAGRKREAIEIYDRVLANPKLTAVFRAQVQRARAEAAGS